MKKIIISLAILLTAGVAAVAQESQATADPFLTKRGLKYLPQQGDIALGVDATPFLTYLGSMFSSGGNTGPQFMSPDGGVTIYGKYFLQDNQAVRAKLGLNLYQQQFKQTVTNDEQTTNNPTNDLATAIDVMTEKTRNFDLSVGYEFRRGHGRVQGFYGAEVLLGYNGGNTAYDWGNPMTSANQAPTSNSAWVANPAQRPISTTGGTTFNLGLGGFVGVEYFVAPQISLGGEFGLGFNYGITSQDETTYQTFNASAESVIERTERSRDGNDVAFDNGIKTRATGSIFVMFHF